AGRSRRFRLCHSYARLLAAFRAFHPKLNSCGTHIEQIVFVHDLFLATAPAGSGLWGETDADPQAVRTPTVHPRAADRNRRAPFFRRDEGCPRLTLKVGDSPADYSPRGAWLHPAFAQPGARD